MVFTLLQSNKVITLAPGNHYAGQVRMVGQAPGKIPKGR